MSFPGSFGSQLTAIMEALLKAVVVEVTALVEDGAVELRLELRDRDRQILEKERDIEKRDRLIEERDRVIEELRTAVVELTAREELAVSPAEERQEQTESCQQEWTKEEEDAKPIVKSEPTEEFSSTSQNPHESLWPPPPPCATTAADVSATCSYDESHTYNSQENDDFPHLGHAELPLDSLLDMNQEHFYPAPQHGFPLVPNCNKGARKRNLNGNRQKLARYRCDQCGKTFTEKRRLATHQSVHTGAKPYSCKKCGKTFSRRDNCVRHEKSDARCKDSPSKQSESKRLLE